MKRWFYISLIAVVFCAGILVGKNQVPQTGSQSKLHKGTLAKKAISGLEVGTQGPPQPISKAHPKESDKGTNASPEESVVSEKQPEEVHGLLGEMIGEKDMPEEENSADASPVEAYQLEELRYSMEEAGIPEEEIEQALKDLASGGVDHSAGWYPPSQEELDAEEIKNLMDAGMPREDIERMIQERQAMPVFPPDFPPELPPDETEAIVDTPEDTEDEDTEKGTDSGRDSDNNNPYSQDGAPE